MSELRMVGQNGKKTPQSRRTRQADTCFVQTATIIPTFQKTWTPVTVEIKQGHVVCNGKEGNIQSDIVSVQDTRNIWKKRVGQHEQCDYHLITEPVLSMI